MTWPLLKMSSTVHAPRHISEVLQQKVKKIFTLTPRRPLMRRRFLALTAAALALPLVMSACNRAPAPQDIYRYKMTVEVETPQGVRMGSAVRELTYHANKGGWFPLGESRAQMTMMGEAVVVDIAPGRALFALLTGASGESDYASRIADRALVDPKTGTGWDRTPRIVELWPTAPKTKHLVNTDPRPQLVHFRDVRDPKSVAAVDPAHLDAAFGPGVTLKRITVQVTDEPVTTGIEKRLGWLDQYYNKMLDGHRYNDSTDFKNTLGAGSFAANTGLSRSESR
jgi:hypothetical protein